jgi:two-component system cell cycle sensor histidine kinase PleC
LAAQDIRSDSRGPAFKRVRLIMTILVGAVMSILVGGTVFWIVFTRQEVLRDADSNLRYTSHLLAEIGAPNLITVDKVLIGAAEVAAQSRGKGTLLAFLRRQITEAPSARALLVIGPDGISRVATNLPDPFRPVDLSDRPYFQHHRDTSLSSLHVSDIIQSRNDGRKILVMSRRIETMDGSFAGIVAATVDLEHLASTLKAATGHPNDAALLISSDGTILARAPDHERHVGQSLAGFPAFERARRETEGAGDVVSPLDGRRRLYAFYKSSKYPIIGVASHDHEVLLRDWRRNSVLFSAMALAAAMVIATLALMLAEQLKRMDKTLEELANSRHAADAANRAKSAFLANMSHELRTPLNAVIGFSDALITGFPGHTCHARCQDYLGHVRMSGRHLLALINDILDLSKIEAGKVELEPELVQTSSMIEECTQLVQPAAEFKDITINTIGPDQDLMVVTDLRRLRQILLNLLSNAIKFTPKGGRIIVSVESDSGQMMLTVNDTGIGMTDDEIAVALTPFGQNSAELAREHAGTGLGLPLSSYLAELLGGSLTVASIPGRGTTVTVCLPLRRDHAPIS